MNKFARFLSQVITIIFVTTTMLSSVYAQTGSTITTNIGSVLEAQESNEIGSGVIILEKEEKRGESIANSGSLSVTESGTGSEVDLPQTSTGTVSPEQEIFDETEPDTNTGSVLLETETGTSQETGTGEVVIESEGREKAMEEIIVEDEYTEILVRYKDDKINVLKNAGKKKSERLIEQKNTEIKPVLRQAFTKQRSKEGSLKMQELEAERYLLTKTKDLKYNNASVLKVKKGFVNEVIEELNDDPNIEHAQPNFQYYPDALRISEPFNTNLLQNQWNLESDYGIHAYEAWETLRNYDNVEDVTVAVIDDGVQIDHPELENVLWDGNTEHGAVYDIDRANANLSIDTPISYFGNHGTHVAGIVAAKIDHLESVSGVSPNAKIMALQTAYRTNDMIDAIEFAAQNGAKVINASWGCNLKNDTNNQNNMFSFACLDSNGNYDYSDVSLQQAIVKFNGLFVTTAGNGQLYRITDNGFDMNDSANAKRYPCAFSDELDNVICVGAMTSTGVIASLSNYSPTYVDITAPGTEIRSTINTTYSDCFSSLTTLWLHDNYSFDDDFELLETSKNVGRKYIQLNGNPSLLSDNYNITLRDTLEENNGPSFLNITFSGSIACSTDALIVETKGNSGVWTTKQSYCGNTGGDLSKIIELGYGNEDLNVRVRIHSEDENNVVDISSLNVTYGKTGIAEKSGTSMAAPHVAGVAAMIYGVRSDLSAAQVKQRIMDTVTYVSELHPISGTHPIKSGGRLNAEAAVTGLETYTAPIILTPTIHAKSTGGDWNSYTTWQENDGLDCSIDDCVLPTSDDVVEINGTVSLTANETISGLLTNTGSVLQTNSNYGRTLTINGDVINNGTLQSYLSYNTLYLNVAGNIENNGTWNPYQTTLLSDVEVVNSTTLYGKLFTGDYALTVTSPNVLTYASETLTSSTTFNGTGLVKLTENVRGTINGTIPRLEIVGGGDVYGTINIDQVSFTGSGTRVLIMNLIVNGDVDIETGSILQNSSSFSRTLTVSGGIVNNGILQNYNDFYLFVWVGGDIENNGTWNPYQTTLLSDVEVVNSTTLYGKLATGSFAVIVNSPNELICDSDMSLSMTTFNGTGKVRLMKKVYGTINGTIPELEIVDGGEIRGTINVANVIFSGNGTRSLYDTLTLNSDVLIGSGITIQTNSNYGRTLTINGDVINNGTLQSYLSYNTLYLNVAGNIENNGTWNPYQTTLLSDVEVVNSTTLYGKLFTGDYALTVTSPNVLTYASETLTSSTTFNGTGLVKLTENVRGTINGTIPRLEIVGGGDVYGTINIDQVSFTGSGTRVLIMNLIVNGDVDIETGSILQNSSSFSRTLTVSGGIVNNGILQNYNDFYLFVWVGGDIENNGTWNPYQTTLLSDVEVVNSTTLYGKLFTGDFAVIVNSPNELICDSDMSFSMTTFNGTGKVRLMKKVFGTINGTIPAMEIVDGGEIRGTINVANVVFSGNGTRSLYDTLTLNSDVLIGSGITIQTNSTYGRTLKINGDVINNGTLQSYPNYNTLYLNVSGNVENNGTWSPYQTKLTWLSTPNATTYEFQITDTNNNWQAPETTNVTYRTIPNSYMNPSDGYRWRTRALVNDVYTDWSITKSINDYQSTQIVTPSGSIVTLTNNNASVEFPENATSQDLQVSIAELDDTGELPPVATNYSLISNAYDFTATNLQGASVTSFDDNVTITLKYNPENLGEIEASTLKVNYYDETTQVWVDLLSIVDTVNHTVTANVNHFTKFAVFGDVIPNFSVDALNANGQHLEDSEIYIANITSWIDAPFESDLPDGNQRFYARWGGLTLDKLITIESGKTHRVTSSDGEVEITDSVDGTTRIEFVFTAPEVSVYTVDQSGNELTDGEIYISNQTTWTDQGYISAMAEGGQENYYGRWGGLILNKYITLQSGKTHRVNSSDGEVEITDSVDGTTKVEFVFTAPEVSVYTVDQSGNELTDGEIYISNQTTWTDQGYISAMAEGGQENYYGRWGGLILNKYITLQSGKTHRVTSSDGEVEITDSVDGTTKVEFVFE